MLDYVERLHFTDVDLSYLAGQTGSDGQPLFEQAFLDYLGNLRLSVDVDAAPEGTVVFPHQPLVRVKGSILQAQLLETPLLNIMNFQTLIATKAARICQAAGGDPVVEFGLRRAQGVDGGLTASRAAYIGGCSATSNVLAGELFGIPVKGTHAHSWVMSFGDEGEAFAAYAQVMPNNCVFLVDTYDTIEGVRHAIQIGRRLRAKGQELLGIRLDSGDLAYLSAKARQMLDEAGFTKAAILATNDLDEHLIEELKRQGAKVNVWGVGTRLATAFDQPALGGVYKLSAVREPPGPWQHKIKLSEQLIKTSTPGILQVRRFRQAGRFIGDMLYDEILGPPAERLIIDPLDPTRGKKLPPQAECEDLLAPMFRAGRRVYEPPPLPAVRARVQQQLACLHPTIRRLVNPHEYPAGLARNLHELKVKMVLKARGLPAQGNRVIP
jgi:nicotinate phosphoribosyltransferase